MIKHGAITALEDSKAAPQKLNHQPFVKNQNYHHKYHTLVHLQ